MASDGVRCTLAISLSIASAKLCVSWPYPGNETLSSRRLPEPREVETVFHTASSPLVSWFVLSRTVTGHVTTCPLAQPVRTCRLVYVTSFNPPYACVRAYVWVSVFFLLFSMKPLKFHFVSHLAGAVGKDTVGTHVAVPSCAECWGRWSHGCLWCSINLSTHSDLSYHPGVHHCCSAGLGKWDDRI